MDSLLGVGESRRPGDPVSSLADTWPWHDPTLVRRVAQHRGLNRERAEAGAPTTVADDVTPVRPVTPRVDPEDAPVLPAWIGPYRPQRRLRGGPIGEVFLAREADGSPPALATIKRLHPHLQHVDAARALLAHEARVLARLDHPGIVRVREPATADAHGWFATDCVHGHALVDVVRRAEQLGLRMPLRHVLAIVASVAEALDHAHSRVDDDGCALHVVHADVSPAHIVIAPTGRVILTDFGASHSRLAAPRTGKRPNLGPVASMSPEQARGEPLDRRSDVYALGVVLWELATWSRLYHRLAPDQVRARVAMGAVPLPSQVRADLPAELEDVMMIALQPAPQRRFATAATFAAALRRLAGPADLRGLDAWIGRVFN